MKEFTLEYVIARLMHEMLVKKENKPQSEYSRWKQKLKFTSKHKGALELW